MVIGTVPKNLTYGRARRIRAPFKSFVESNRKSIDNVEFDDPMTRAYAMITDDAYAKAAGNVDPEEIEKKRVGEPTLDRTISGKAMADFAFPETKIGKKGIPKENAFQVATLEQNLVSLQPKLGCSPFSPLALLVILQWCL